MGFLGFPFLTILFVGPSTRRTRIGVRIASTKSPSEKTEDLRRLLFDTDELTVMPCCYGNSKLINLF